MLIHRIGKKLTFPNPNVGFGDMPLCYGGDLSADRLILAYQSGIFPWFSDGEPILWWSPDPRAIIFLDKFKITSSLLKIVNSKVFEIRTDSNFESVIENCSKIKRKNQNGTWITQDIISAYSTLHKMGLAHSFETYLNGELVGGLYGVSLGRAFFGESMFSKVSNASKVAMFYLVSFCKKHNFDFIDAQVMNEHLKSLGANDINRNIFLDMLSITIKKDTIIGEWKNLIEDS